MILALTAVALVLVCVFLGAQVYWTWGLARLYPPPERPAAADGVWPRVAVVLPTRGADPSLIDCLEGLLDQDYPLYDIRIVVDSCDDPPGASWPASCATARRAGADRAAGTAARDVQPQGQRPAANPRRPGRSCRAVVLIDADVVPHPQWLRDLVQPLADPTVGATTGVPLVRGGPFQLGLAGARDLERGGATQY